MWSRLADRLRGRYARLSEQDIERAIDIIVEQTDQRLRFVRAYRRKLRKPVVRALVYADDLIARIPGPFQISRKAYGSDPQVNALFGSADDIDTLFAHSKVLQDFFRDNPGCDLVYVPLIMLQRERQIFGMALGGDIVRRDVARTSVNFSEHRLGMVRAASEAELRGDLKWRGIHFLAVTALENITRLKAGTAQLEEQRALLKVKLRDMQAQHRGLDALVAAPPANTQEKQALEQRLEDTGRKLQEVRTGVATLDDYLEQVCRVLNHPSHFLRVKHNSVTVDRMGIKSDVMSHQQGSEVVSATITIGAHPAVDVIMASFQRMNMATTPGGN
jgi:hypothetical protein